jgi:hypothetical protein
MNLLLNSKGGRMVNIIKLIEKDQTLLGKVIVLKKDEIIHVLDTYKEAFDIAKNKDYLQIFKVPPNITATRILPLRIKNFKKHPWVPLYPVKFFKKESSIIENCLIDSGADISAINYKFGIELGLIKEEHDYFFQVEGLGGVMDYLLKSIKIEIDNKLIQIPVAWLQDEDSTDVIIGREVVFDIFDIEFKQKTEEVIFKPN